MLYGEYDSSGNLIREYIYVNGAPVAQIDAGSPESILYLHTDHLLTPRYATDSTGATVWSWDSGAFGAEAPTGSATVNLRFPGQYYDAETGLHYNWHRYYDPATGRYITSDPLGLAAGLNTYGYAGQNPLLFIDPDGQFFGTIPWWGWAGVAVGVAIVGILAILDIWDVGNIWAGVFCTAMSDAPPDVKLAAYGAGLGLTAVTVLNPIPNKATKDVLDKLGESAQWVKELIEAANRRNSRMTKVRANDADAEDLARDLGGDASVRFNDDPRLREFDAVTEDFVAQVTRKATIDQQWRNQAKATFERALAEGKTPYFRFIGQPDPAMIRKLAEYAKRYGVEPVIEIIQ